MHMFQGIRNTVSVKIAFVVISWLLGLLFGTVFLDRTSFLSLMSSVYFPRTSIVGFIISMSIPLFISYILLRCFDFYYLVPLIILKAFTFMCIYGAISITYGNAGWLVSGLLLFSDFSLIFLLIYQWLVWASGKRCSSAFTSFILLIIGCFDLFIVSPYAAVLLNY